MGAGGGLNLEANLAKSVTNLPQADLLNAEEEVLVHEVRQKLNALLLFKYQHSKATRELAEVRSRNIHHLKIRSLESVKISVQLIFRSGKP